jgi:hypothetical protein
MDTRFQPAAGATGINNLGDVTGFATSASGVISSRLIHAGHLTAFQFPGGTSTQAFGINKAGDLVGFYTDAARNTDGMLAQP